MSQVLVPPVVHPVAGALAAVGQAWDSSSGAPLWSLSDTQLMDSARELHRLRCQSDALLLRLVREVDARGAAVNAGAASTAMWLRSGLRMHPGEAKRTVATAAALHCDPAGPLVPLDDEPDTAVGAVDGPDAAGGPGAGGPDGAAGGPQDAGVGGSRRGWAATRSALAEGAISVEHVGVIASALHALPAQVDRELVAQGEAFLAAHAREHDPQALAALGKRLLHHLDPDCGDRLAEHEQHRVDTRALWVVPRTGGGYRISGELDTELGASLLTVLDPYAKPHPASDHGTADRRSPGQRNADALAHVLALAMSHPDVATVTAAKPTIVVTLDLATLTRQPGADAATLDWAGPISAEAARRLACDARIIPVVLGAHGEPLDVGRASYATPLPLRRALAARDRGCAFPGCDRPPGWTQSHHIIHWADGGHTTITNLVLLCGAHHRTVHHAGWEVTINPHGIPEFRPPPWIDPARTPRAKPWRAQLAALTTTRTSGRD